MDEYDFDLQALLDQQPDYVAPSYYDSSSDNTDWSQLFSSLGGDTASYDTSNASPVDLTSLFADPVDLTSLLSSSQTMSPDLYQQYTGAPTEQELIDWVSSADMPMADKIDYLQKLKLANGLVEPDAYSSEGSVSSPDEQGSMGSIAKSTEASKDYGSLLKAALQKQAYDKLKAQENYGNSGIGKALSGLGMAALLAKELTGKNQGATVSARSNQGQSFAPTYQKATAPKTKYAHGGEVKGKGGLLHLAEQMAREIANQKGLVSGQAGGQDDVVDIKAAPGEYMMDAEVVSALGDGNNEEGARKLDQMRMNVRKHKRTGGLSSIPPKAKKPEQYMKKGK